MERRFPVKTIPMIIFHSRRIGLILISMIVLGACAGPRLKLGQTQGGEVVEAEGSVVNDPADPVGTRKKALVAAQKSAVEKVSATKKYFR